jgi:CRP-like cAMP-binding protein
LSSFTKEGFSQLAEQLQVNRFRSGELIFRKGEKDDRTLFLLAGTVKLDYGKRTESIDSGSEKSRYALSSLKPRRSTARAMNPVILCSVRDRTLQKILTWDQMTYPSATEGYEVVDMSDSAVDSEWMIRILRTPAFLRLPTANIQTVLARFDQLPVATGQVIIREGEEGNFFYIVKEGRCRVTRRSPDTGAETILGELGDGDGFGEEALVSERPRNATVTMVSDGVLMRLDKEHFTRLIKEPLLKWVDSREAAVLRAKGATLLDVRLEGEFRTGSIAHSRNLPLYLLRSKVRELDKQHLYVLFCDTGARSAAAAYLLAERGFDVRVLRGGLAGLGANG